jgi:hypothetical protein
LKEIKLAYESIIKHSKTVRQLARVLESSYAPAKGDEELRQTYTTLDDIREEAYNADGATD